MPVCVRAQSVTGGCCITSCLGSRNLTGPAQVVWRWFFVLLSRPFLVSLVNWIAMKMVHWCFPTSPIKQMYSAEYCGYGWEIKVSCIIHRYERPEGSSLTVMVVIISSRRAFGYPNLALYLMHVSRILLHIHFPSSTLIRPSVSHQPWPEDDWLYIPR